MTVESFDTVAPKIGFALPDAAVELVFNRPLGDAKLARDFGLGKLAEFAEDDDFTATGRQRGDGIGQDFDFFLKTDGVGHGGLILYDAQL